MESGCKMVTQLQVANVVRDRCRKSPKAVQDQMLDQVVETTPNVEELGESMRNQSGRLPFAFKGPATGQRDW